MKDFSKVLFVGLLGFLGYVILFKQSGIGDITGIISGNTQTNTSQGIGWNEFARFDRSNTPTTVTSTIVSLPMVILKSLVLLINGGISK